MVTLYGMRVSPRTRRVRWALEEAGVPYEHVEVNVPKGETRTPEFLRVNPLGTVPALVHGGVTLCESNAILAHLCEVAGGPLACVSPAERAHTLQWLFWEASTLGEPLHHAWLAAYFARIGRPADPTAAARALEASRAPLTTLENHLAGRDYVATGRFGVADVAVASSLAQCAEAGVDLTPWPRITAWLATMQARPPFVHTSHVSLAGQNP